MFITARRHSVDAQSPCNWRYRIAIPVIMLSMALITATASAATFSSVKSGDWTDPTVWGGTFGGPVPGAGDTVTVNHSVMNQQVTTVDNVTVANAGVLTLYANLTVDGGMFQLNGTFYPNYSELALANGADISIGAAAVVETGIVTGAIRFKPGACTMTGANGSAVNLPHVYVEAGSVLTVSTVDWTIQGTLYAHGQIAGKSPEYDLGSIQYNSGGNYTTGAEWTEGIIWPPLVYVSGNTHLTLGGSGNTYNCYGVLVDPGSEFTLAGNNLDATFYGLQNSGTTNLGSSTFRLYDGSELMQNGTLNSGTSVVRLEGDFVNLDGTMTLYDLVADGPNVRNNTANVSIANKATVKGTGVIVDLPLYFLPGAMLEYDGATEDEGVEWSTGTTSANGAPTTVSLLTGSRLFFNTGPLSTNELRLGDGTTLTLDWTTLNVSDRLELGNGATIIENADGQLNAPSQVSAECQVNAPGTYTFPYLDLSLEVTAVEAGGTVLTVESYPQSYPGAPPGIQTGLWWNISSSAACTANVSLPISHLAPGANPYVCHYSSATSSWDYGRDFVGGGFVTRNNISSFSPFAAGDANLGALPVSLSSFEIE